jgi:MFS transporter, MHS family, proline/betaine transporter
MTIANMQDAETVMPVAGRQMSNAILASVLGWSLDLFDLFNTAKTHSRPR